MGESNCLLRSFSDTSCYAKEGDPIGALAESISFGRFISESLAWEKWSAFSHNRYVQEAENFSRPGSVAAKKAYFEAHFRRRAAERAAAAEMVAVAENASALIQEANSSSSGTSSAETQDENRTNSSIEIKSKSDGNLAIIEQLDKDAVDYEVVDCANTNNYKRDIEQIGVDISRMERAQDMLQPCIDTNEHKCDIEQRVVDFSRPEDAPQLYTATNINMENSVLVDKSSQFDNVAVPKEERMPDQGTANQEKRSKMNSSTKLSSKTRTVKLSCSPAERKAAGQARYKVNSALQSKKSVGDSIEKKRQSARSLHMSINLSSRVGETSNKASVSEHNILKRISPNLPRISKDLSVASQTSIRASNHASANPPTEGKRTDRLFNKSVSGAVTANGKFSLHSVDFLKSSSTTRGNTPSPTISSPFRFRSDERVAKRKEFFERMGEIKSKEAEKMQLQRRYKENTGHDYKKLRKSNDFKPKPNEDMNDRLQPPNEDMNDRLQPPSHQIRKQICLTRHRSPILGRTPNSSMGHDINPRNSWKPPISGNTLKHVTEKTHQTRRHSPISITKKIRRENVSPNIQC